MKISETTTIGFASAGHTLCHLLTLLFPTVLLALEVELELSFKEFGYIGGFRAPSFLEHVRYRQVGLVIDGAKPPCWKYIFTAPEL